MYVREMRAQTCELSEKFFLFGGFLEPAFLQNVSTSREEKDHVSDIGRPEAADHRWYVRGADVGGWPKIPLSSDEEDKDKEEPGRLSSTPRRPASRLTHGTHLPLSLPYRI